MNEAVSPWKSMNEDLYLTKCEKPGCAKPVKAKGLCSAHLSQQYRQVKKPRSRHMVSVAYVASTKAIGPVKIAHSINVLRAIEGTGLKLYGAFIASPEDIKSVISDVDEKLTEFDLRLEKNWYDVCAADGVQMIRKCATLRPISIMTANQFAEICHLSYFAQNRELLESLNFWGDFEHIDYTVWIPSRGWLQRVARNADKGKEAEMDQWRYDKERYYAAYCDRIAELIVPPG